MTASQFRVWLTPDVAARAATFPRLTLQETPANSKYLHAKGPYRPPFGWENEWTVYVAPLCYTENHSEAYYRYWRLFSDLKPASIAAGLKACLRNIEVTVDEASSYGLYPVTFSRALWEEDVLAMGALPWVHLFEPKQHFGELILNMTVNVSGHGDVPARGSHWIGNPGEGRIEGFQLTPVPQDLTLEYMAHVANQGDTPWVSQGYIGTHGLNRAIEGFAVRLTGDARYRYDLTYQGYLHDRGQTQPYTDGAYCGTRGEGRAVEALKITITRKSGDDPITS
jgi:hypothetical protein